MSLPLIDMRSKITAEADAVLEAQHKATGREKSEIVRDVLHKWAVAEIHTASVLSSILLREGIAGQMREAGGND